MMGLLLLSVLVMNVCAFYMGYEHFGKPAGYKSGYESGVITTSVLFTKELSTVVDTCPEDVKVVFLAKMDEWVDKKNKETAASP